MTDYTLHGNCEICPACELRREGVVGHVNDYGAITDHRHVFVACNECGGFGLKPLSDHEIIARTVEEARLGYWPAREAAWAQHNGNVIDLSVRRKARAVCA